MTHRHPRGRGDRCGSVRTVGEADDDLNSSAGLRGDGVIEGEKMAAKARERLRRRGYTPVHVTHRGHRGFVVALGVCEKSQDAKKIQVV